VTSLQRAMTTAGITVLIAFVGSCLLMWNAPYHSDQRGFAWGALKAASWLEVVWVPIAVALAIRWRGRPTRFLIVLLLNSVVFCLLIADVVRAVLNGEF